MIRFTLFTGPMFAQKTTRMAALLRREMVAGHRTALLRPLQDTRRQRAISFIQPVLPVSLTTDPFGHETAALMAITDTIAMDEVQFIAPWVADFLDALAKATRLPDVHVIAAGLDLKADGTPWPGMDVLADLADEHTPLTATCDFCGAPATMTLSTAWMPEDGVRPGDAGYHPACRACWQKHAHTFHNRMKESA